MNKDTFWVVVFQLLKILNGLISVLLIPIFLSIEEQGIWFLILSFGSIILLFSASQNSIVVIFGAHEFKNLKINKLEILGEIKYLDNLYSFLSFSNKFFIKILSFIIIIVFIFFYFYIDSSEQDYNLVFLLYLLGLYLYAINFSILSYLESFNVVQYSYMLKSILMLLLILSIIIFLVNDFGLFSLSLSFLISMSLSAGYLFYRFNNIIRNSLNSITPFKRTKEKVFLNYFKKNSFSMVSGFLLFQIYTPLVYYYKGSEYSGKVGLSIAIFTALFAVSISILQAKIPSVIKLIAVKKYLEAYEIYFNTAKKTFLIYILLLVLGMYLLFYVDIFNIYKVRIVEINSFLILSISWFLQLIVYILVTYVRCFKRELFIPPTIVSVIYILISTSIILSNFSVEYIFLGLLSSYIFGLPWIYYIYKNFFKQKD